MSTGWSPVVTAPVVVFVAASCAVNAAGRTPSEPTWVDVTAATG